MAKRSGEEKVPVEKTEAKDTLDYCTVTKAVGGGLVPAACKLVTDGSLVPNSSIWAIFASRLTRQVCPPFIRGTYSG